MDSTLKRRRFRPHERYPPRSFSRNIKELATGVNDMSRAATNATRGMQRVSASVETSNREALATLDSAEKVHLAAEELNGLSSELLRMVGQFTV